MPGSRVRSSVRECSQSVGAHLGQLRAAAYSLVGGTRPCSRARAAFRLVSAHQVFDSEIGADVARSQTRKEASGLVRGGR